MAVCNISSVTINFLQPNISSLETVVRWMKFCQLAYIDHCDLLSLHPSLTNIYSLKSEATYGDCFNTKQLASYCISIILSAAILVANSLIIAAFFTSRKLLTSSNLPILSLAISDLVTGLAFIYPTSWGFTILVTGYNFDLSQVLQYVDKRQNYYLCLLLDGPGLLFACMMSSILSLGIIATERYIAVFHSYKYPFWITTKRMVAAIVALWVISLIVAILPLCGWNNWQGSCQLLSMMHSGYLIFWTTICFLCGFLILFVYIRIFCLARKHNRQIKATQVSTTSMISLRTSTTSSNDHKRSRKLTSKTDIIPWTHDDRKTSSSADNPMSITISTISGNIMEEQTTSSITQDQNYIQPESEDSINQVDYPNEHDEDKNESPTQTNKRKSHRWKKYRSKSIFKTINMKAIRTTSMILGAFYICWSPFLLYMLVYHSNSDTSYNITAYYLAIITQLNSLFNPILYGFRHLQIKQAVRNLFKCRTCKSDILN